MTLKWQKIVSNEEMRIHVCASGVETADHCLSWTGSQQTRFIKHRRGSTLHRRRIDKLEVTEKREDFQGEMARSEEQLSELLEIIGTTTNVIERDNVGARIIEGWEQLVKTTSTEAIGKKVDINSMQQSGKMVG